MNAIKCLIIFSLVLGCQKKRPPIVNLIIPTNEQVFHVGERVNIEAELSDPDILLNEYLTVVSGNNYRDTIIKFKEYLQRGSYSLSKYFFIQTSGTFKITVGAFGGSSITEEKTVYIRAF